LDEYRDISLKELFVCISKKFWIIVLTAIVFGIAAFFFTRFLIVPQYKATISMYVNNKTESTNSLSTSDVAAAKSLVDTYITIIESSSVLEDIIDNANIDLTASQIRNMMSAKSLNGTEVFEVSITSASPEESEKIANLIADFAPSKISEIVNGSSVKIIDRAKVPTQPASPIMSKNIVIACLLGLIISCFTVIVVHMFDTTIHSEDDIKEFSNLPVLGIFLDFNQAGNSNYGYSYGRRSAGKWAKLLALLQVKDTQLLL